ncbi:hypothetical protein NBH00_17270 [Paraconexibacter antarcticus]|uniref:Uncharacterized protein n=1 Tax=Paraconexibacter antarcticus TaxID=2949664 RepID=A0ABY5DPG7_9ACTN|nr:hypothetical protein [Paraconexibacter antarcticus]UTI63103.1 hypothetical protein NBH00_17270 [Paraconexibacter antarcticus]
MDEFAEALREAGGMAAPRDRIARLRALLAAELRSGAAELRLPRSGQGAPVTVVIAAAPAAAGGLAVVLPVDPALRADPDAITERAWLLTAATVGALVDAGATGHVRAGHLGEGLAVALGGADAAGADAELAVLAFEEQVAGIDRLRARALAVPAALLEDAADLRDPIGAGHPLLVAAEVARQGGRPADPASVQALEDTVLARLEVAPGHGATRPHDDPDPARRVARRILQRLAGMGKWGGYHTEFAHLARGFAPADRALAAEVGEALLAAGLLAEKPSVGQRHVFLDPRRAAEIHALTDRGDVPPGLRLPAP